MDSFGIVFSFFILSKFTIGSRYDCNRFSLHLHLILVTFKVKDKRLMKRIVLLIFGWLSVMTAFAADKPTLLTQVDQQKMMAWTDSVFNTLSMDERIGQLFMVIADVKTTNQNMQRLLRYVNELNIGGVLFHKGSPEVQAQLTNRMQEASKVPLLVSLDGEWGLSMRLSGTPRFPKNMMLGAIENDLLIRKYGEEVARQCKEMGIHINFAPDLDVNSNVDNPVIGIRSFGEDPAAVADKGIAYASGLEEGGIMAVAKHFPGHGDTSDDSHETLPVIYHSRARLDSVELFPFKQYIQKGFAGVMTAHLYIPALDKRKNLPSSLSEKVVKGLLQDELGFQGLCFTDALAMKGAGNDKAENPCVKALLAGNDILLAPYAPISDYKAVKEAIEGGIIPMKLVEDKCKKILQYKYVAGLNRYQPIPLKGLSDRLNTAHAAWLAAQLNAEAITLLKNEDDVVPLKKLDQKKIAVLSIGSGVTSDFEETVSKYVKADYFTITRSSSASKIQQIYTKLDKYDLVICAVHTVRIPESQALRKLAERKQLVYAFFTIPYFCKSYKQSIEKAKAVVMGYEGTPFAQQYAAQVIFGGIGAKGKLPVSIPDLYYAGTGIFTEKVRLGYHEPEAVGLNAERLAEIGSIAEEGLQAKAYPGCQLLVAKDGWIVYNRAFGSYTYSKEQPVTTESVYDLASASKAAGTLLAVMKAYDEKKFKLTDKISTYIPELKDSNKSNITIRELLFHQSGLVPTINFYTKAMEKGRFKPDLVSSKSSPEYTWKVADGIYLEPSFQDTITQMIKRSKLGPKRYRYSCVNFILLKMMTEEQLLRPMDDVLESAFWAPLGAWHTTYNPLEKMDSVEIVPTEYDKIVRHQLIRGYVHDEAAAFQGGVSGNAGLFSNANDLAKVLQLYLNDGSYGGEQLLSAETVRLFTQTKSPTCRRGLGFDKPATGGKASPCGSLASPSVYGHTGFTGTCFWVDPDQQLIYIFLSNRVYPTRSNNKLSSLNIRTRIQDTIYKAIEKKEL